ncbi:hypothetical protein [Streptomyces sp. NBRC 110028]|uniref:hypothetical protein n=1 Tax=Streptomyces sp. NBRC 110028 TaxID=1621260 RepID=UPI000A7D27EF|nr:hypothetical protein [Streptomyces sp. NBRC 110028]
MVPIVFALLFFGVFVGAVAHIPVTVSLVAGSLIIAWLVVFTVRERLSGRGEGDS